MFPMRDHLYELAKLRENELMEIARREQQLEEARNHSYQVWSLDTLRHIWQKMSSRLRTAETKTQASVGQVRAYGR